MLADDWQVQTPSVLITPNVSLWANSSLFGLRWRIIKVILKG